MKPYRVSLMSWPAAGHVEQRAMLHAQVLAERGGRVILGARPYLHALNDVVLGRTRPRTHRRR